MSLYSIYADYDHYAYVGFDREEMREKFGRNPKHHIDTGFKPTSYKSKWQTLTMTLAKEEGGITGDNMADIMPFAGKLFLNMKAYNVLKSLIENDGEFLPVTYEEGDGYIFNPLSVAESVDGLNIEISHKNEWGEIHAMTFHEERVKDFAIFRSEFDRYQSIICQQEVRDIVEAENLGGVYFTLDLGNPFTTKMSEVTKTN